MGANANDVETLGKTEEELHKIVVEWQETLETKDFKVNANKYRQCYIHEEPE